MSEHIQTNIGKFKNKHVFGRTLMDDGVSEEAHKSSVTKISKAAEVSQPVILQETTRSIENYSHVFDRLQCEF